MQQEKLSKLAERIRQEQLRQHTNNGALPELYADRHGHIGLAEDQGETTHLARLTEEPMFSPTLGVSEGWLARQRQVVREKLPPGTVELHRPGTPGWAYEVTDRFGFTYTIWVAFDTSQAMWFAHLVDPKRQALTPPGGTVPTAHDVHLFEDGVICLCHQIGYEDLETTYARTCLWCLGASSYRSGLGFPFSVG